MTEADNEREPRRGQAVAAVAIAAVAFMLVVATWIAWLLVRPRMEAGPVYPIVGQVFLLVLGALFFVGLLAGVLAIVLGLTGGGREYGGEVARAGVLLGGLTCVVALGGAVAFAVNPLWTSTVANFDMGTLGNPFGR
ncbi:hypothetical protein QRX50_42795 [Amycolatopsis carbonis]|uniref:Uncharacterized protein n=1 Tax=Amycolatopsis carbonis TaxID=715471 RepID=A0A9Y2MWK3_9PSEU|nr:hypothetical protein [Amycolatopsis sp. 2-15]WIX78054.1 hypothetical protein QRX50_42795 [Amycolatopsis sp. 2-15]